MNDTIPEHWRKPTTITLTTEERGLLDELTKLLNLDNRSATVRALAREKMLQLNSQQRAN